MIYNVNEDYRSIICLLLPFFFFFFDLLRWEVWLWLLTFVVALSEDVFRRFWVIPILRCFYTITNVYVYPLLLMINCEPTLPYQGL